MQLILSYVYTIVDAIYVLNVTIAHIPQQAAADALRFMDKMELDGRLLRVSTPTPVRPADAIASDLR
jgi:hypothetical protein